MKSPPRTGPYEPGYFIASSILIPWLSRAFRYRLEGIERIPKSGPAIVAVNHVSLFDPLAVACAIHNYGRRPRFFGKASLFDAPIVGWILSSARQIRVDRGTAKALASLEHAEAAVEDGEVIVVFPEGTTTIDPDLKMMSPKSGVARLAFSSGLPVIPCATWGGQWIWSYFVGFKPGWGKKVWIRFGEPVTFEKFRGREKDPAAWEEATSLVMDAISKLLEDPRADMPWTSRELAKRARRKKSLTR